MTTQLPDVDAVTLTTHHGAPVAVLNGIAYDPADMTPAGVPASDLVSAWAARFVGQAQPGQDLAELAPAMLGMLRQMLAMYDAKRMTPVDFYVSYWADVRELIRQAEAAGQGHAGGLWISPHEKREAAARDVMTWTLAQTYKLAREALELDGIMDPGAWLKANGGDALERRQEQRAEAAISTLRDIANMELGQTPPAALLEWARETAAGALRALGETEGGQG